MFSIPNSLKRKIFPKSLLTRFMLIIIVPTLIGQLLAVYLFYQRHWYNVSQHTSELIATEISSLMSTKNYKAPPYKKRSYLNLEYVFISDSILPKAHKKYIEEFEIFKKALKQEIGQEGTVLFDEDGRIRLYLQNDEGILQIRLPYKALLNPTTYIFVLWMIFLTILLLSVSLIFSKNQIKSIIELTNAAEKYGGGDKNLIYKPSGSKEIRKAGLAFLKMKDRIERQTTKRTQMLAMISHDLKTPLTRMKLQVELMDDSEEKEELQYDIESMQHMILSYLDFARGEGGEEFQVLDINNWLKNYITSKWPDHNITTQIFKKAVYVKVKPHSFERAITNLISNALKYSTKVVISVCSKKSNAFIIVEDNGSGIKPQDRKLVFKPFYRGDKSRSLEHFASVGLGLAITKEIINGHYGNISLGDSKKLKGLLVKIQLPLTINNNNDV
jgi:two-component system osmolarity sensor histidine kinase EnvZ